jgi:galactose oxidase
MSRLKPVHPCHAGVYLAWLAALALSLPASAQSDPAQVGQWSAVREWPVSATHAALLPTGKVFFFGEFDEGNLPPLLWDPATELLEQVVHPGHNIFCVGHSFLADGRLLLTGGHVESHVGLPHTVLFDPFSLTWQHGPDMNDNRWYPTNTTLPNGEVVVLAGEISGSGTDNRLPQVYQPATNTYRDLTTAERKLPYYPRTFTAPDGRIFYAGPGQRALWLDTRGTGRWSTGPLTLALGRNYGAAVMYDSTVLLVGGGRPPLATAEKVDLASPNPLWEYIAPMHHRRRQLNTVLLPDGSVLAIGGSSADVFDGRGSPVLEPELWNPVANQWTRLAPHAEYRGYHSTALLLPDGRVLSGGGRNRRTYEVFSPPYLFKGARPTVSSAPASVRPAESFLVQTPDAERVDKVTLIALSAVTHAFDQNQRLLTLNFQRVAGGLRVVAPANNNAAPPGYYMLFLVDGQGVPSVAHRVQLQLPLTAAAEPPPPPGHLSYAELSRRPPAQRPSDEPTAEEREDLRRHLLWRQEELEFLRRHGHAH